MPLPIAVLLGVGVAALVIKAIIDRKGSYNEPGNEADDRFSHMWDASSYRDKALRGQGSVTPTRPPHGADGR